MREIDEVGDDVRRERNRFVLINYLTPDCH